MQLLKIMYIIELDREFYHLLNYKEKEVFTMKITNKERISCSLYKEIREKINELRKEELLSFNGMLLKLINVYEESKKEENGGKDHE